MTTLEIFILSAACVCWLAILSASIAMNTVVWYWCPKCHHWHSDIGIANRKPATGRLSTVEKICDVCR